MPAEPKPVIAEQIVAFKRSLTPHREAIKRAFKEVKGHIRRAADATRDNAAAGRAVIPEINFRDIQHGSVSAAARLAVRETGCAVVRCVFKESIAGEWFAELSEYLEANRYAEREVEKRGLDAYFSHLRADKPQIFNVYWSKPQVRARQDPRLAETRAFLDRIWNNVGVFNPGQQCSYADRVRRRQPGDKTLGLSPHMDAGTVERWIDGGYQRVYESVFAGAWRHFDPFDATHRLKTREIPSPAVCSMFRTYQGWTALTRQGPGDGTLQLAPIANGICYVLLRALQDDIAEDDLCGASPGRALGISAEWHPELMAAVVLIPEVAPGDTVWWHPDVCHAVGDEHSGDECASVIYIGSAPDCEKNRGYLSRQKASFLAGRSPPDFAAMDFEIDFQGRATENDLNELGRRQMGFW